MILSQKGWFRAHIAPRIFGLWGLLFFVPLTIIFYPFYIFFLFIPDPYKTYWHKKTTYLYMSCFLTLSGCRMKVYGKENIKKDVQYIIAFNHNSFMDVMFGLPFLPIIKGTKFLSKKSMMLVPFLNIIFASGAVLIDRKSKESRNTSIVKMKYILENYKLSMAIYPEGSRNRTDVPLTKFYNGAFTIAVETKLQILPVLLFNTTEPFPPDKFFYLWPANMEMHILPPHDPYNIDVEQLRDNVFHTMYTYYEKHDKVLSKNN